MYVCRYVCMYVYNKNKYVVFFHHDYCLYIFIYSSICKYRLFYLA